MNSAVAKPAMNFQTVGRAERQMRPLPSDGKSAQPHDGRKNRHGQMCQTSFPACYNFVTHLFSVFCLQGNQLAEKYSNPHN